MSPASPRSLLGGDLSVVKRAYVPHTCLLGSAFASTAAPRAHNVVPGPRRVPNNNRKGTCQLPDPVEHLTRSVLGVARAAGAPHGGGLKLPLFQRGGGGRVAPAAQAANEWRKPREGGRERRRERRCGGALTTVERHMRVIVYVYTRVTLPSTPAECRRQFCMIRSTVKL